MSDQRCPTFDPRGRHAAVAYDGDTTITYACRCGREYKIDHGRGPVARRLGVVGVGLMFRHFTDGGCTAPPCSQCQVYFRRAGLLPPSSLRRGCQP